MPLGSKPSAKLSASGSFSSAETGLSMPALGSCSTRTSVASPHVLPVSACRLERPTDHAGYWSVIPSVSDSTWKKTIAHAAIPSGDRMIRPNSDSRGGSASLPLLTKWNQAASSATNTVSPRNPVVNPKCHCGNAFDHGTPKFETYHQPLTLANDSATVNNTTTANSVRLRRERIAAAVTATAANAPSETGQPGEHPEVVRPLGRREHHRDERDHRDADDAAAGPGRGTRNASLAQRHCHRYGECDQQCQQREPSGDRPVRAGHEQPLVADVLVEPAQARPERTLERGRLQFAGESLVTEDQDRR